MNRPPIGRKALTNAPVRAQRQDGTYRDATPEEVEQFRLVPGRGPAVEVSPAEDDALLAALRAKLYAPDPVPLTFTLTIELGNERMRYGTDVADVLHDLSIDFRPYAEFNGSGAIVDVNGNTVGSWGVK